MNKIYLLSGQKVMLAADLGTLFGIETKRSKEQIRRNTVRFPAHFMFELTREVFALRFLRAWSAHVKQCFKINCSPKCQHKDQLLIREIKGRTF